MEHYIITPVEPRLRPRRHRRLERPQQTLVDIASRIRQIEARLKSLEQERARRHKLKRSAHLVAKQFQRMTGTVLGTLDKPRRKLRH